MEELKEKAVVGFDVSKPFLIKIQSAGEKQCLVRFATDAECCAWGKKPVTVRRFLGRGKTQTSETGTDASNAELLAVIREDQGSEFEPEDASLVIGKLFQAVPQEIEREGVNYRVVLKVTGGIKTTHVVRMPTAKQMKDHEAASVRTISNRRSVEMRALLEPSGELYDNVHVSHEGYQCPVPIVHKVAVISELMQQIAVESEDDEFPE